jgi:hypothetical protein
MNDLLYVFEAFSPGSITWKVSTSCNACDNHHRCFPITLYSAGAALLGGLGNVVIK